MWPVDQVRERASKRRSIAALSVLIGAYAYSRLGDGERNRVDNEATKLLAWGGVSSVSFRRFAPWAARSIQRGWAMARLGVGTQIPGVSWPSVFYRSWLFNPLSLFLVFRRSGPETEEAIRYLRSHGAEVPSELPLNQSYQEALTDVIARRPVLPEPWKARTDANPSMDRTLRRGQTLASADC